VRPELAELPELQRLIEQAMAKECDERFADATDLLRVLDELLMSGLLEEEEDDEESAEELPADAPEGDVRFGPKLRDTLVSAAAALQNYARAGRERWRGEATPQLRRARRELYSSLARGTARFDAFATRLAPKLRGLSNAAWSRLQPRLALAGRRISHLALEAKTRIHGKRLLKLARPRQAALDADASEGPAPQAAVGATAAEGPAQQHAALGATAAEEQTPHTRPGLDEPGGRELSSAPVGEPDAERESDAEREPDVDRDGDEDARSASDTADPLVLEPRDPQRPSQT
jgi:hypothetical protein